MTRPSRANQADSGTRASRRQRGLSPLREEQAPPPGARMSRGGVSAPKRRAAPKKTRRGCSDGEGSPPSAWKGAAPVLPPPGAEAPLDASPAGKPEAQRQPFPAPDAVSMPPTGSPFTPTVQPTQPAPPALTTGGSTAFATGTDPAQAAEPAAVQLAPSRRVPVSKTFLVSSLDAPGGGTFLLSAMPPAAFDAAAAAAMADPWLVTTSGLDDPTPRLVHGVLGASADLLRHLGTPAEEARFSVVASHLLVAGPLADLLDFHWGLHHAADLPLVLAFARHAGACAQTLAGRGDGAVRGACVAVDAAAVAAAAAARLDPGRADQAAALGAYLRQLEAECEGMGAGAAALGLADVSLRLGLVTTARLFMLSLAVVVGAVPKERLAHWKDPRFVRMMWNLAQVGLPGA